MIKRAVTTAVVAALVAACGSSSSNDKSGGAPTATAKLAAAGQWAGIATPEKLDVGRSPVVIPGAQGALLIGGYRASGDGTASGAPNVGLVRIGSPAVESVPNFPGSQPLYAPGGVSTGEQFIVLGRSCERFDVEDDAARCGPQELRAGSIPEDGSAWTEIGVPDDLRATVSQAGSTVIQGLGWNGQAAVFSVSIDGQAALWSYGPQTDSWSNADFPKSDGGRMAVCTLASGETVAVVQDALEGDPSAVADDQVYTLDTKSQSWRQLEPARPTWTSKPLVESVRCGQGILAMTGAFPDRTELSAFDGSEWQQPLVLPKDNATNPIVSLALIEGGYLVTWLTLTQDLATSEIAFDGKDEPVDLGPAATGQGAVYVVGNALVVVHPDDDTIFARA